MVAPGAFLPAAERHGLICDIDRLVLEKVVALLAGQSRRGAAGVAVNLSALSVTDRGMLDHVQRLLARARVDPARLVIELTETSAISDMARAKAFCTGAQELGCAVALDDFGAGFGSFQYLKHLPFSYLKIDGDFIRGLTTSRTDQLVVQRARAAGARDGQADDRRVRRRRGDAADGRDHGVDYAQGYAVGPPVDELALGTQALVAARR